MAAEINIPEDVLTAALRKTYADDTLSVTKVAYRTVPDVGVHCGGDVGYLDVDLEGRSSPLQLFVKSTSEDSGIDYDNFVKELKFFKHLIPALQKFSKSRARNPIDLNFFPLCVHTACSPSSKVIVLENISSKGYQVVEVKPGNNPEIHHMKAVIEAIATLHAVSYSLRLSTGKPLLESFPFLQENLFSDRYKDTFGASHDKSYSLCLAVLDQGSEQFDLLKSVGSDLFEDSKRLLEADGPFNVVCHGDLWNGNCMFLAEDNKPVAVKLIDFQLPRCSHLLSDVTYYLSYGTTSAYRQAHLMDILQWYRDKFVSVAKSFDVPQIPFTSKELIQEYYALHKFWVGFAVQGVVMKLSTNEDMEKTVTNNRDLFTEMPLIIENVIKRNGNRELLREGLLELCEEIQWIKGEAEKD